MKLMNVVRKYGSKALLGSALVAASAQSMAAVTTIDTTEPLAQIAEGAGAASAIGLALIALMILIGVFIKLRRAGS